MFRKIIKINILIVFYNIITINYSFSLDNLINKKYANFLNEWNYDIYNEKNPESYYSGTLIIDNCNNKFCEYKLFTISTGGYDCISEGKVKILNDTNAIIYSYDYDTKKLNGCRSNISLSDGGKKLKINEDKDYCWFGKDSCALHGRILDDYKKRFLNGTKTYKTSFLCENLNFISDIYVCTDKDLAKLDLELNKIYNNLLIKYKNVNDISGINDLKKSQKDWLKKIHTSDILMDLQKMYINRINELKKLENDK